MFFLKISCFLIVVCGILANDEKLWLKFKKDYNKTYSSVEDENFREQAFFSNVKLIQKHNEEFRKGNTSYGMEINEFADIFPREFGDNSIPDFEDDSKYCTKGAKRLKISHLPDNVNWVERGFTNPVLKQGDCGSCYAFVALAAIEAQYFIENNKLIKLSEQDVINCGYLYDCKGCDGGRSKDVFRMAKRRGILFSSFEPYKAEVDTCKDEKLKTKKNYKPYVKIAEQCKVNPNNEEELKRAVAEIGPIAVSIEVKHNFWFYKQGVYYEPDCNGESNHGVLVVGYGTTQEGEDYWIVRNSWGENWGDKGHAYMSRNRGNNCGIATYPRYPISPVIMNSNDID